MQQTNFFLDYLNIGQRWQIFLNGFNFLFVKEHSAICNKEDKDRVRVQVEKFRGETWFDREGKKMKISFEMNTSKELGRHSVAKTIVFGE